MHAHLKRCFKINNPTYFSEFRFSETLSLILTSQSLPLKIIASIYPKIKKYFKGFLATISKFYLAILFKEKTWNWINLAVSVLIAEKNYRRRIVTNVLTKILSLKMCAFARIVKHILCKRNPCMIAPRPEKVWFFRNGNHPEEDIINKTFLAIYSLFDFCFLKYSRNTLQK